MPSWLDVAHSVRRVVHEKGCNDYNAEGGRRRKTPTVAKPMSNCAAERRGGGSIASSRRRAPLRRSIIPTSRRCTTSAWQMGTTLLRPVRGRRDAPPSNRFVRRSPTPLPVPATCTPSFPAPHPADSPTLVVTSYCPENRSNERICRGPARIIGFSQYERRHGTALIGSTQ